MASGGVAFTKGMIPVNNYIAPTISVDVADVRIAENFTALPFTTTGVSAVGEVATVSADEAYRVVAYDSGASAPATGAGIRFEAGFCAVVAVKPGQRVRIEAAAIS